MLKKKVNNIYKMEGFIFNSKRNHSRKKEYETGEKHYHCAQHYPG